MKEQFVNYEIALELKELGFNEECIAGYSNVYKKIEPDYKITFEHKREFYLIIDEEISIGSWIGWHEIRCLAPLWQQVIDWLREKKHVNIEIRMNYPEYKYFYTIGNIGNETFQYVSKETFNYKEAREKAILQALKLIKGGKSN